MIYGLKVIKKKSCGFYNLMSKNWNWLSDMALLNITEEECHESLNMNAFVY